jgi:hypothetical protein
MTAADPLFKAEPSRCMDRAQTLVHNSISLMRESVKILQTVEKSLLGLIPLCEKCLEPFFHFPPSPFRFYSFQRTPLPDLPCLIA